MSNYAIVTNFLSKDSLISGNPLKAVKGADLTTEFTAVQTALNSKFDGVTVFSPDGNAAQPSFGFTNNAGVGMFNAAGVLGFSTSATLRFSLSTAGGLFSTAVTGGDKGVGTINAAGLFVNGVAVTAGGVSSIAGTANQIAASASTGAVTLSIPSTLVLPGSLTVNAAANYGTTFNTSGGVSAYVYSDASGSGLTNTNPFSSGTMMYLTGTTFEVFTGGVGRFTLNGTGNSVLASPSSGAGLTVNGAASANTLVLQASTSSGNSGGVLLNAGTTSADNALIINNAAASVQYLRVAGDGGVILAAATGGDQGLGTLNATGLFVNGVAVGAASTSGTFTGTFTGGTTAPTVTCKYTKIGTSVTVRILSVTTMVSNANTFTITGIPAAIQPTTAGAGTSQCVVINNSNNNAAVGSVSGGTLTFSVSTVGTFATTNFVGSGTKGIGDTTLTWDTN